MKHIVGFSGGADSQATALWARQKFPATDIVLLFSDTGWEDCLTYEFIQNYSANVFQVTTVTPLVGDAGDLMLRKERAGVERAGLAAGDVLTMERLAAIKGRWASSRAQFCTSFLKLYPQKRWMEQNIPLGEDYERYAGVRRDESKARRDVAESEWDDFFDCTLNRPLASWSKAQVFDFLAAHGEAVNPLYRMGQSRVGCSPCHNRGKDDIRKWAAYRPEEVEKVRQAEKRTGRTFFPPVVPGMVMNFIDDVVAWAKTERGGKQISLPFAEADAASGTCSSKYGLCE